jgi:hypothetical protein
MTPDYQAVQGRRLFGTGAILFGHGQTWFHAPWPGGIFTRHPLNTFDALFRAEIVLGAILAAYGILVWRHAAHDLSLANYILVASGASAVVLCASRMSEWVSFLYHQQGASLGFELQVAAVQLAIVTCILVFGGWWADSTFMREHFRKRMHRFVKLFRFPNSRESV